MKPQKTLLTAAILLALTACSSGGGGSDHATAQPNTPNAAQTNPAS